MTRQIKSLVLFTALYWQVVNLSHAQSTVEQSYKTKVTPPSPNAAALGKYGEVPVSYYTGIPNIEIPITTAQSGEIQLPITLSYHAGGIKLNEEAGWTGLGWTLNAGGVVSRMVNDKDDLTSGYFTTSLPEMTERTTTSTAVMYGGYEPEFNRYYSASGAIYDWTTGVTNFSGFDLETDIFNYSFGGRGGKFSFTRSQQIIQEKRSDLLIERIGSGFKITDENGIQYLFTITEMTDNGAQVLTTSWYLSKIYSPKGDSITFNYITGPSSAFLPRVSEIYRKGCDVSQYDITSSATSHQIKYLTSITYKNGRVEFEYDSNREDMQVPSSGKKLTTIKLFVGSEVAPYKRFELSYSYFLDTQSYVFKRLRLDRLTEIGNDGNSLPSHQFVYEDVPANVQLFSGKNSFSVDHWGYFNGAPNTSYVPGYTGYATWGSGTQLNTTYENIQGADRETNPLYSKIFSLKEIIYPTGGKTVFDFESNTFDYLSSTQGQVFDIPYMQLVSKEQNFTISAAGTTNGTIDLTNKYGNVDMIITFRCSASDGCASVRSTYPYGAVYAQALGYMRDLMGAEVSCNPFGPICTASLTNLNVTNSVHPWSAYIAPSVAGVEDIIISFKWKESVTVQPSYINQDRFLYCGGIRVKSIANYNEGKIISRKNYVYHVAEDRDLNGSVETYSYGKRMSPPSYYRNEILTAVVDGHVNRCPSFVRYSNSVSELSTAAQGNIVGYDKVIEYSSDSTGITLGKTEMNYFNQVDSLVSYRYPAIGAIHGSGFLDNLPIRKPGIRNLKSGFNGNLLSKVVFTDDGGSYKRIREELNYYSYKDRFTLYNLTVEEVNGGGSDATLQLTSVYPAFRSEMIKLDSTVVKDYSAVFESQLVTTKTQYYYENNAHVQPTRVVNLASDGNSIEQKNRNALDNIVGLAPEAAVAKTELTTRHIIGPVLETETIDNGQSKIVRTNYKVFSGGLPLPANVETKIGAAALDKRVEFLSYDGNGNLTSQSGVSDVVSSYIWGYDGMYPIAEVLNAKPNEIFFTSFEDSEANAPVGDAHNGVGSRTGGYSKLLTGLTTNKTYSLTYWQKLSGVWTLQSNEVVLSGPASSYTISLSGHVDDVRFYPKNAQMTTYTYQLGRGITSVTDANNVSQYYTYDEFGRLIAIRDKDQHLLKVYKYNYKSQ